MTALFQLLILGLIFACIIYMGHGHSSPRTESQRQTSMQNVCAARVSTAASYDYEY